MCLLVLAQAGAAGKGLAILQVDIWLLTAVGHLVEEQMGIIAKVLATLTSVRLLVSVCWCCSRFELSKTCLLQLGHL